LLKVFCKPFKGLLIVLKVFHRPLKNRLKPVKGLKRPSKGLRRPFKGREKAFERPSKDFAKGITGAQGPGVGAESANAGGVWEGRAPPLRSWGP